MNLYIFLFLLKKVDGMWTHYMAAGASVDNSYQCVRVPAKPASEKCQCQLSSKCDCFSQVDLESLIIKVTQSIKHIFKQG